MPVSLEQITERFSSLLQPVRGNLKLQIEGLSIPQKATSNTLIFVGDRKHLEETKGTQAQAWVVNASLTASLPDHPPVLLTTQQVSLAMALIGRAFFAPELSKNSFQSPSIHPSAVIDPSAELGRDVLIGPHCAIGPRVKIGAGTVIGANTTLEAEVEIGLHCHIHSQVYLGPRTRLGKECEIHPHTAIGMEGFGYATDQVGHHHRLVHFGRVVIGDRVHIGANVSIDRGTFDDSVIGDGTIIDNHCHFAHNVKIGKGTVITAGFIAAGSTQIGDYCVFGGRSSVSGHLKIASQAQFAGLSGVQQSVETGGKYGGFPLQPLNQSLKTLKSLPHVPRMRRQLARVMKHLGLQDDQEE